jgi:undecaprenyl-diphosphatase
MVVATLYEAYKTMLPHKGVPPIGAGPATTEQWIALAIGVVISFIVAYGVVAWFMAWVRKHGFVPFAVWRLLVGAFVLLRMAH